MKLWATVLWTLLESRQPTGELPDTGVLPGPLAEPLQFPNSGIARWPLLLLLLAAILWALYRWWQKHRAPEPAPETGPAAAGEPPPTAAAEGEGSDRSPTLGDVLRALRARFLASESYREGCHALSVLLKRHFEALGSGRRRLPWTHMTAREIHSATDKKAAPQLLVDLSTLRFGRSEPSRKAFERACHRAEQVVGAHLRKKARPEVVATGETSGEASDA